MNHLKIPKRNNVYKMGKSDLFAVLISLKYLLEQDEMDELVEQIQKQLRVLYSSTKRIQKNQIRLSAD